MAEEKAGKMKSPAVTDVDTSVTYTGKVVWFNYKTGFGYIKPDDATVNGGKDVFVHYSGISDNLAFIKEGREPFKKLLREQAVQFNLGKNSRGIVAVNVDKAETDAVETADEGNGEAPAADGDGQPDTPNNDGSAEA